MYYKYFFVFNSRCKGIICLFFTQLLMVLQFQDIFNVNFHKEAINAFGNNPQTSYYLQLLFVIILVYMFIILLHSLSKINFGKLLRLKSDQSTFLISILSSSVLYSYVSFPLSYNFAESVIKLENSELVKVR